MIEIENARTIEQKQEALEAVLRPLGRVLVGYSGGVDSAVLAVAAHRVLGENAIAVTADSESYASGELEAASELMRDFGIRHEVVRTAELQNPDYASNPVNRCYFCKQELFTHMQRMAAELEADAILYGQNRDDVGDFRPGAQAAREYGVRAPLQEAGLGKQDVRDLARVWGLPVWNRPAMACLSSRFPYGTPVTAEGLRMVDRAEAFLRGLGFEQLRVRHHTDVARIELPAADLDRLLADSGLRRRIHEALTETGYRFAAADLRGFRSGSLNEVLKKKGSAAAPPNGALAEAAPTALGQAGIRPGQVEEHREVTLVRVSASGVGRFAAEKARSVLVDRLEAAGARYVSVDLRPLAE